MAAAAIGNAIAEHCRLLPPCELEASMCQLSSELAATKKHRAWLAPGVAAHTAIGRPVCNKTPNVEFFLLIIHLVLLRNAKEAPGMARAKCGTHSNWAACNHAPKIEVYQYHLFSSVVQIQQLGCGLQEDTNSRVSIDLVRFVVNLATDTRGEHGLA